MAKTVGFITQTPAQYAAGSTARSLRQQGVEQGGVRARPADGLPILGRRAEPSPPLGGRPRSPGRLVMRRSGRAAADIGRLELETHPVRVDRRPWRRGSAADSATLPRRWPRVFEGLKS